MNMKSITAILLCCLSIVCPLCAQTDVTSLYLENAGFDNTADFVTSNVYTYAHDTEGNGGVSSCQPVTDWIVDGTGDAKAGGVFQFGSGFGLAGSTYIVPTTDSEGNASGGALGLATCWTNSVGYSHTVTLPKGVYRLSFKVYNAGPNIRENYDGTFGFIESDGTAHYADGDLFAGEWTETVVFLNILETTTGTIHVGYSCGNVGSANTPKLFVDYVKIEKYDEDYMMEDFTPFIDPNGWSGDGTYKAEGVIGKEVFQWAASLNTGRHLEQKLTGLPNGIYNLSMLVCVSSTSGRDNTNNKITDGSLDYASFHANDKSHGVPAYNREDFNKYDRIELNGINVTDGTLDLYLNQDLTGPNWHVVQVKRLTRIRPIPSNVLYLLGDIDENRSVAIPDVTALVNIILNGGGGQTRADVNEDGAISIPDVTQLVNIILGTAPIKTVDLTHRYANLDAMVYAEQQASDNSSSPAYMLTKAQSTISGNDVSSHYDLSDFLTTLNITTTLNDVASVSIYALDKTAIAGPMNIQCQDGNNSVSYSAGQELIYSNSQESDVVTVSNLSGSGTYTAYLRPVSLSGGVLVTIRTTDGRYYSQNFTGIKAGEVNNLIFTQTAAQNLWMATIPGNTYFSMLSTPGAHNAATSSVSSSQAKCQSETIAQLLANGVRAFDLRPRYTSNTQSDIELENLTIYHGITSTGVKFKDAIDILIDFVKQNPSEAVSVIMNKENSSALFSLTDQSETWRASMRECFGNEARSPYLMGSVRGYHTLDDVRGRVSIVSRNPYGNSSNNYRDVIYGAVIENWPDDGVVTNYTCDMTQAWNWVDCRASVEDAYNSNTSNKTSLVEQQLQLASSNTDHFHYNYTYTSIANSPASYANTMNPATVSIISNLNGPLCYVYADFMGSTSYSGASLLRAIVEQNYKYVFEGKRRQ